MESWKDKTTSAVQKDEGWHLMEYRPESQIALLDYSGDFLFNLLATLDLGSSNKSWFWQTEDI